MRYLGPPFYGNWKVNRDMDEDGNCIDEKVLLAKQFSDRDVRYWFLGMENYRQNHSLAVPTWHQVSWDEGDRSDTDSEVCPTSPTSET